MVEMMGFEKQKFRRSKFRNVPTEYNGTRFKSKLEARTAMMLDFWIKLGVIWVWDYEPIPFTFEHTDKTGKRKDITYVPDFAVHYMDDNIDDERIEWWECKGMVSAYDLLKWELFKRDNPDFYLAVIFAGKLRIGKRGGLSVFKYNKINRIVDRVWDDINSEFKKYKGIM